MRATDEDLVEAFQGGDTAAFDVLVQRWDRKIQGAIYRFVGPTEDARDLCQEAFLKAYRGLRTFKKDARFSSWLYQIALNVCRDRLRRRRGRTVLSLDEMDEHGQDAAVLPGPSPLDLAEGQDIARRVSRAVASPYSTSSIWSR
jgi:RNA polymerase sigma-70 factor (ECF subfamily)